MDIKGLTIPSPSIETNKEIDNTANARLTLKDLVSISPPNTAS